MKKIFSKNIVSIIACFLVLTLFSCYSEDDLRQKYDQGYSDGNKSGYNKGYAEGMNKGQTDGYKKGHSNGYNEGNDAGRKLGFNTAKNEYKKQINDLQTRIAAMERNHRTELTASHNRGFQEGEISMEKKILAIVDLKAQEAVKKNKKNGVLFFVK
ncbi:MAG: hypothetical protein LBH44_09930 [Treponema sp.]|jgi:flagellar biosynthesis/type III secretory pathway protein FliH|nr:hypothetical protein [Treponema sp.]